MKTTTSLLKQAFTQQSMRAFSGGLNQLYIPNKQEPVKFTPKDNRSKSVKAYSSAEWSLEQVTKATEDHVVFTWGATDPMRKSAMAFKRGEGIYLYDYNGKKYVDMTS
jgi:4-aminobutyrate aminotransferase-like enzyme